MRGDEDVVRPEQRVIRGPFALLGGLFLDVVQPGSGDPVLAQRLVADDRAAGRIAVGFIRRG
jgi:hypothetical protein